MKAAPHIRATVSADGVVFMDIRAGLILSANATGARVWQGLLAGQTLASIAEGLGAAYAVDVSSVRSDVDAFVRALVDRGIVDGLTN